MIPATGLAHCPVTEVAEVAERHDRSRREQHDLGHRDGRVNVGKHHEGHSNARKQRTGAGKLPGSPSVPMPQTQQKRLKEILMSSSVKNDAFAMVKLME